MINTSQRRILTHLSAFPRDLEASWDVPREISLPGIAESVGVVRSAVHAPLKELESLGFVITRSARTIGAGTRKRKVVHITEAGRDAISSDSFEAPRRGPSSGPIPKQGAIFGREEEIKEISSKIADGSSYVLSGLPGIGKTSLARSISELMMNSGWRVRWATCSVDSDVESLATMWLGRKGQNSTSAIAASVGSNRTLLVIDEAQQISSRHFIGVNQLILDCSRTDASMLVVVRAPNPFENIDGFHEFRLDGLKDSDALEILPEDLDEAEALEVVRALGGHPLALNLWSPDDEMPARAEAVQSYVETTVIRRISESGMESLDELCISPLPIKIEELAFSDGIDELDELAIIRWSEEFAETHHLIGNVRRESLSEGELRDMHSIQETHWKNIEGARARRIETHHHIKSRQELDVDLLKINVSEIATHSSASAAVLMDQAIGKCNDEDLKLMATDLALERGESDIARSYIDELAEGPNRQLRQSKLAMIDGDQKLSEELLHSAIRFLDPADKAREEVASVVRMYDDRLPGLISEEIAQELSRAIEEIDFSNLTDSEREGASLSLNLLRHAIALDTGDLSSASSTRSAIESRLGPKSPRIRELDLRAMLTVSVSGELPVEALSTLKAYLDSTNDHLDKLRMIHLTMSMCGDRIPDWLQKAHLEESPQKLENGISANRRIKAQWWYWRGIIEPENRLSNWREAINRFKSSGCINASRELIEKLSKQL